MVTMRETVIVIKERREGLLPFNIKADFIIRLLLLIIENNYTALIIAYLKVHINAIWENAENSKEKVKIFKACFKNQGRDKIGGWFMPKIPKNRARDFIKIGGLPGYNSVIKWNTE